MNVQSKIASHKKSSKSRKGQTVSKVEVPLDSKGNPEMTPEQIKEALVANIGKGIVVNTTVAEQPQPE